MRESLESRLRQHQRRALVRSWEYRQRRHAHGVWFRLRRVLASASAVYVISGGDAGTLTAEGHRIEPVGLEFDPAKRMIFVPAQRVAGIASARPVAVRLNRDLLAAECLALTRFETAAPSTAGLRKTLI